MIIPTEGGNAMFRILVVEDDAELRGLFRRVLEKNGYTFVQEEFGAEDDPYGKGMLIYRKKQ